MPGARTALFALAACFALAGRADPAPAGGCKLALVLALDISSSVNSREYEIQLFGLARAFRTPAVIVYEWSGYNQQDVVIPWTILDSEAGIRDLADRLAAHRRPYTDLSTALGKAVEYGARMFAGAPSCARRVIDISGDGANNDGPDPDEYRARGTLDGIVINGLVVQGAVPDPAPYYREHVIQGPRAFLALARDFDDYPSVIVGKLLREIGHEMIIGGM